MTLVGKKNLRKKPRPKKKYDPRWEKKPKKKTLEVV